MRRALLILLLGLAIAGCDSNMSDLKAFIAKVKARDSSKIKPIPEIAEYKPYTYHASGRPSPFKRFETHEAEHKRVSNTAISPNFAREKDPLEQYPLDALAMVGTLTFGGTQYALIRAPDGVVHRVSVGEHMGLDFGEVVEITSSSVRLIEIVPNGLGGYKKRPAIIALSD